MQEILGVAPPVDTSGAVAVTQVTVPTTVWGYQLPELTVIDHDGQNTQITGTRRWLPKRRILWVPKPLTSNVGVLVALG